jgi:UDP-glucose 4-epimerase
LETSIEIPHIINRIVLDSEIVFHLAARNIIASTKSPVEDYKTNIEGTLNVLIGARNSNIEKLVYTSSASVYGNPRYLPINEDDSINLLTPYAVSKYTGEGYCMAFYESYGVPVTVLRLSNVYGPRQSPENPYCGVVSKFMKSASCKEPLEIHGDGQSTRDFTYVDDVVDAIMLAGLSHTVDGEVLNVATGIETSINQLAVNVLGLYAGFKVSHIDRRDIDNIRRRVLNIEKIRRRLHWTPRITLSRGLETTKDWFDKTQV